MPDGQPSWTLHDPARDQFFRIDWPTFEILSRWALGEPERIAQAISDETTLQLGSEAVVAVAGFLADNELLMRSGPVEMAEQLEKLERTTWQKFIHNYLFFRVPLIRPDPWLRRWLPTAMVFQSRNFLIMTLVVLMADIWLVASQSQVFFNTLVDTLSVQGFLFYGLAVFAVKLLHELGHAFVAKRYGCTVPVMGIAFMVLWPVAYTDTNSAWRLTDRWQRLRVSAAGIAVEMTVAVWATLAWALLPPGSVQSAAYFLATTSWVMTLLVNASPFMRFDGYFILCDLLDMPNLHARSFALARWQLREFLFRLNEVPPEHFAKDKHWVLIIFAMVTWAYRLAVFFGIAIIVYHFTIKLIGIGLFVIEIYYFVLLPIVREIRAWRERWPTIQTNPDSRRRSQRVFLVAGAGILLLAVPLPSWVGVSGLLQPVRTWNIIAPDRSQIVHVNLERGLRFAAGVPIVRLQADDIEMQDRINQVRIRQLAWQASSGGLSEDTRSDWQVDRQNLAVVKREGNAIAASRNRLELVSPFAGTIADVEPGLGIGQWVGAGEKLGVAFAPGHMIVETYLVESDVRRVSPGDRGTFVSDSGEGVLDLEVALIARDATRALPDGVLTTLAGGHVPVRHDKGSWIPDQAFYRVVLVVRSPAQELAGRKWRGKVVIWTQWTPAAAPFVKQALSVVMREAGF